MESEKLTPYRAVGLAEGFIEPKNFDEYVSAYQYLINTGIVWNLQGWFGREAMHLINEGFCTLPE